MTSAALLQRASAILITDEKPAIGAASIDIKLPSHANLREHHFERAKRVARHRQVGGHLLLQVGLKKTKEALNSTGLIMLMTRVSPLSLDSDNLESAFKGIRDGIAKVLGVDDRDERIVWLCDQHKGSPRVELAAFKRAEP